MTEDTGASNFIRERIAADVAAGKHGGARVIGRPGNDAQDPAGVFV